MLTAQEIRQRYLDFFASHQHKIVQSGPLIPPDDPSLLFTNAGMVQFKEFFLDKGEKPFTRATTCQKCLRVSGKHNDLENVGRTARHHTFFEMLGNFSFGDYFKKEAITWAWEFVTKHLELPKEKLWVTVYKEDNEAAAIWQNVAGLPQERIVRMGEKDNFWTMGDTGPCGPCSEIYIDQGEDMACGPDCGIGKCDCDRFLEIWNLVFTQFDQLPDGRRVLLAAPNIDTGMGLERIAAVCQGKRSNFDCDLFQEIIQYAAGLAHVQYSASAPNTNDIDTALRVIADHGRAAAFLIAEGVLPSNENRGYVLRRLIRRALRFATLMGVHEPFLHNVAVKVTEIMGNAYPELAEHAEFIRRAVYEEERRFALTLDNGLKLLEEELQALEKNGSRTVPGEFCFRLYDTYGFPLDIVVDVTEKRGFDVDCAGFEKYMREQRERARQNQKKSGLLGQGAGAALKPACEALLRENGKTDFTGYASLEGKSVILRLLDAAGNICEELGEGQSGYLIAGKTPFYGEAGGQCGDKGIISTPGGSVEVTCALKPLPEIIVHEIRVTAGEVMAGQECRLQVNADVRKSTARNHTCTHLLHAALRRVLGKHVKQSGSLVDARRLRFDFSHLTAMTQAELAAVERDVNRIIMADLPVTACEMDRDAAMTMGAMALFSEKYGERVRVLTVGRQNENPESVELCGGTHLEHTGEAGSFYIVSESAVAAGVRRIEAITGWEAYNFNIGQRASLAAACTVLKCKPDNIAGRAADMSDEMKKLRKQLEKGSHVEVVPQNLAAKAEDVGGTRFLKAKFDNMAMKSLRDIMDQLRGNLDHNVVICLAGVSDGKVSLLVHVAKDLQDRYTAPLLIKEIAPLCGGSGGGRPDLAQAGGSMPEGIEKAFAKLRDILMVKEGN